MTALTFGLTEKQRDVQQWVHAFAESSIRPVAAVWDEREATPWPVIIEAASVGLYSLDFVRTVLEDPTGLLLPVVAEELAWGDPGMAMAVLFGTVLPVIAIGASGTRDQIEEWQPRCFGTVDQPAVAAFCVSEPDAGSDVAAMRTRAVYDQGSDTWVLDGTKTWITNGGIAGVHIVTASVEPALGARGQASFIVPPDTPGLAQGQKFVKMGLRASHTAEVVLDGVRVPGANVLGGRPALEERLALAREGRRVHKGQPAMATFEASRPMVGAMAVGIARAALEYATAYATERIQFGRPIAEHQAVAFMLADMRVAVDASRLLVRRAASMIAAGEPFEAAEGSQSKLFATEAAVRVTEQAIQILGGAGYTRDHPVERWHRAALVYPIFEGTSEIQRLIISRAITRQAAVPQPATRQAATRQRPTASPPHRQQRTAP